MVVFTEFLPTLEYLAHLLDRSGIPYAVFSGELSRAEKDAAIARFRDDVDLLISTGVGGEGRNLQFANTVINFDFPWNPMRIEQRVGRVHRIGQTKEVFVFNFCQAGSVEEQLLRLLHDKINMFELVVGEFDAILGSLDESRDFATELDRVAKLEDLVRKFSPRARLNLAGLLVLTLPVEEMTVRLTHKKEERVRTFHWNHCLHLLEPPRCERCSEPAAPLQLCERMHCLCRECRTTCPRCGRQNCRICRPRCPCGEEQG